MLVYFIVPFLYKQDYMEIIKATFIPTLKFDKNFIAILVGILGTTISPYLFFWQASVEVEEMKNKKKHLIVVVKPMVVFNKYLTLLLGFRIK
jgi:Mn2+/Fe2+ NRAMP family transporter